MGHWYKTLPNTEKAQQIKNMSKNEGLGIGNKKAPNWGPFSGGLLLLCGLLLDPVGRAILGRIGVGPAATAPEAPLIAIYIASRAAVLANGITMLIAGQVIRSLISGSWVGIIPV